MFQVPNCQDDALALDRGDPLAPARSHFEIPGGTIYLVGHSLGPPPAEARRKAAAALDAWQRDLVRGWNSAGWIDLAERMGARIAGLIGAEPGSVVVTDNVSVNLFKLASAALGLARRPLLMIEEDEFPTDQYIVAALGRLQQAELRRVPTGEGIAALKEGGVLIKSVVNYRSAEITDMAAHEAEARRNGALIVWDLSHATGVLNLALCSHGAQLAAGCTYKYLNGGPGAPALVYASPEISGKLSTPLPGWMGHAAPFAFESHYAPREGAARFASGTQPILSLASLDGALDVVCGQAPEDIQTKARRMGAMAIRRAKEMGLELLSPQDDARRGGHVSLRITDGYPVVQALAARGVLSDFRAPDTVRLGFSPLFLTYAQVWEAMDILGDILSTHSWDAPEFHIRAKVT
ncbi:aminotransferase class V-fold PLP-dependent enzyme [Hyphomonas sp.]|uniref:aminotransferase class V-fold PLP-dependent enzyme n=1 Tax=Hyphomonas sp. TaxID=87 RepID=UPI00391B599E